MPGGAAAVLGVLSALNVSATLALGESRFSSGNLREAKLLVPCFVGRATGLRPIVVFAILIGVPLASLLGMLVAVPLIGGRTSAQALAAW